VPPTPDGTQTARGVHTVRTREKLPGSGKKAMKTKSDEIEANLDNPEILEKLYRSDKKGFRTEFEKLRPGTGFSEIIRFWKVRLEYDKKSDTVKMPSVYEITTVLAAGIITAVLIKIPDIFRTGIDENMFYLKNAAIIIFTGLTLYTILINRVSEPGKIIYTLLAFLVPAIYINLLPSSDPGASVILACIHLPVLMWFIYGIAATGYDTGNLNKRADFIRFNGRLAIVYVLVAIAGALLAAVTIGLFDSIDVNIEKFYTRNIIIMGAVAAPVAAAFISDKYPALVGKTAPLLAGIFSPLVLITLAVFLATMLTAGKNPYKDRDFLLIFNIMLLGVTGIIIFSVFEAPVLRNQKFNAGVLLILSLITVITDLIALSAIFFRLGEYGLTPNRLAVLMSNILILINLILIMIDLIRISFKGRDFKIVEMTTVKYLPVYMAWVIIVVFGFPAVFGMQ
jgi:hypothetical protein